MSKAAAIVRKLLGIRSISQGYERAARSFAPGFDAGMADASREIEEARDRERRGVELVCFLMADDSPHFVELASAAWLEEAAVELDRLEAAGTPACAITLAGSWYWRHPSGGDGSSSVGASSME